MNRILIFFLFIFLNLYLDAQVIQQGIVCELNSKGKPVSGVGISLLTATDLQPTASNTDGTFRLVFSEKKAGDIIYNLRIIKEGYEIVNRQIFQNGWKLSGKDTLKIIVAPKSKIDAIRSQYYHIMDNYRESEYRRTIQNLHKALEEQTISTEEYRKKMEKAEQKLSEAYQKLEEYADLFARINKDDLDTLSRQALDFFEAGQIDQAIAVFENSHLLEQLQSKVKLRHESIESIRNLIPKLQEEATYRQMAAGPDNLTKTDSILRNIALADSTNFEYLFAYTTFLTEQNDFNRATLWNQKALQHAILFKDRINALRSMGHLYYKASNYNMSLTYLQQAIKEVEAIKDIDEETYLYNASDPMNTLANLQMDNGQYSEAEKILLECVSIRRNLVSKSATYLEDYGTTLNNTGELYRLIYEGKRMDEYFEKALPYYNEAITIRETLAASGKDKYIYDLANVYNNKGVLYLDARQYDTAIVYLMKSNELFESIAPRNPPFFSEYMVNSYNNIGMLYSQTKQYDNALKYYSKGLSVCDERIELTPEIYLPIKAVLLLNKGVIYRKSKQNGDAKNCYMQALNIRESILTSEQRNCSYSIYEIYVNLSTVEFASEQLDSAIYSLKKALDVLDCLSADKSNKPYYFADYLTVNNSLAYVYYVKKDVKNGLPQHRKVIQNIKLLEQSTGKKYQKLLEETKDYIKKLKAIRKERK